MDDFRTIVSKSKSIQISECGLTSTVWPEYSENTKRIQYRAVPTSDITAEAVTMDGFTISQKDSACFSVPSRLAERGSRSRACLRLGGWLLKPHPAYGWDLTKNICELYGQHGYLRTAYTYSPYGQVTAEGDVEQNIQWSSEFNDTELGLVYYNYRHYNPVDGRWTGRDVIEEIFENNIYIYINKNIMGSVDAMGLAQVSRFSYWHTWQSETFGKNITEANIEKIAKEASEVTGKHIYDVSLSILAITNTSHPIQGKQIRHYFYASCECDDGCRFLNNWELHFL